MEIYCLNIFVQKLCFTKRKKFDRQKETKQLNLKLKNGRYLYNKIMLKFCKFKQKKNSLNFIQRLLKP